ncbi:ERMES complex subunit [Tilletia horrida]|nr:ERMES complex subunit [Tilletia horrida]
MSFRFEWPEFGPEFHAHAAGMLNSALNKGPRPKVIADDIRVKELNMGTIPPELDILEIGDLTTDRFRGIFRLTYTGDAHLILSTKVQANPLSRPPAKPELSIFRSNTTSTAASAARGILFAASPLIVPMHLRLSHVRLRAIVVLVVSKSKGVTLVFKNDPLESVDVSSTFDGVAVIQKYLQQEIEGQLREMFREDLPGIIHRLSQSWLARTRDAASAAPTPNASAPGQPAQSPPTQTQAQPAAAAQPSTPGVRLRTTSQSKSQTTASPAIPTTSAPPRSRKRSHQNPKNNADGTRAPSIGVLSSSPSTLPPQSPPVLMRNGGAGTIPRASSPSARVRAARHAAAAGAAAHHSASASEQLERHSQRAPVRGAASTASKQRRPVPSRAASYHTRGRGGGAASAASSSSAPYTQPAFSRLFSSDADDQSSQTLRDIEEYDPTYGLRPDEVDLDRSLFKSGFSGLGRLLQSGGSGFGGLQDLADEQGLLEEDEGLEDEELELDQDAEEEEEQDEDEDEEGEGGEEADENGDVHDLHDDVLSHSRLSMPASMRSLNLGGATGSGRAGTGGFSDSMSIASLARPRIYHVASRVQAPVLDDDGETSGFGFGLGFGLAGVGLGGTPSSSSAAGGGGARAGSFGGGGGGGGGGRSSTRSSRSRPMPTDLGLNGSGASASRSGRSAGTGTVRASATAAAGLYPKSYRAGESGAGTIRAPPSMGSSSRGWDAQRWGGGGGVEDDPQDTLRASGLGPAAGMQRGPLPAFDGWTEQPGWQQPPPLRHQLQQQQHHLYQQQRAGDQPYPYSQFRLQSDDVDDAPPPAAAWNGDASWRSVGRSFDGVDDYDDEDDFGRVSDLDEDEDGEANGRGQGFGAAGAFNGHDEGSMLSPSGSGSGSGSGTRSGTGSSLLSGGTTNEGDGGGGSSSEQNSLTTLEPTPMDPRSSEFKRQLYREQYPSHQSDDVSDEDFGPGPSAGTAAAAAAAAAAASAQASSGRPTPRLW